jgi:class 3 adenylate cyclase
VAAQTRAFLFSDLRGYSAYTEAHGDHDARELLHAYRGAVREVIASFDGSEIRTEGDSFYVVFASVSNAVQAGLGIAAAADRVSTEQPARPVRVGVGIHAGEVEDSDEGIVSSAVNIAARICALAEAGEVLVSDTVRSLTRGYLDVGFVARGDRRLKGIAEPIRLYRVTGSPADGIPRGGGRPTRRWPMVSIVGIGAGIVLAAAAVIAGTLMNESVARSSGSASPGAGSSNLTLPSASLAASVAGSGDSGFTAEERALIDRLPSAVTTACVSADPDEIPTFQSGIDRPIPLPYNAALRCHVSGGLNAFFFATTPAPPPALRSSVPETTLFGYAGRRGVDEGTCDGSGIGTAVDRWSFGDAEGWILCGDDIFWTYDGTNILGRANGGRDASVTMAWWRDNARFPAE